MARKAISKKVRFEVFKRDSFKCQYCGASAPDVILEVDHIQPVAKRGKNDIMNLLTACKGCNAGKSDRLLDDSTAVSKQKAQADRLSERRLQLQMMMEWRNGLIGIKEQELAEAEKYWRTLTRHLLTDRGRDEIRKILKTHTIAEVCDAMEVCDQQYSDKQHAFRKISGVCYVRSKSRNDPAFEVVSIVRGILLKNIRYIDAEDGADMDATIRLCLRDGITRNQIINTARECRYAQDVTAELSWLHNKHTSGN